MLVVNKINQLNMWWRQDVSTAHTSGRSINNLRDQFPRKLINKRGDWPCLPHSLDLAICNFFLWGHLKQAIWTKSLNQQPKRIQDAILTVCNELLPEHIKLLVKFYSLFFAKNLPFLKTTKRFFFHIFLNNEQNLMYNTLKIKSAIPLNDTKNFDSNFFMLFKKKSTSMRETFLWRTRYNICDDIIHNKFISKNLLWQRQTKRENYTTLLKNKAMGSKN